MRWRPIRSWVWPDGSVRTECASHTLSSSVRAMGLLLAMRPRRIWCRSAAAESSGSPALCSARSGGGARTWERGGKRARRTERERDRDRAEADAEGSDEEPEVAAERVVQPASRPRAERHAERGDGGDGADRGADDASAEIFAEQ